MLTYCREAGRIIVFAKSRRLELGDSILRTLAYRFIFNHCDIIDLKLCKFGEKNPK